MEILPQPSQAESGSRKVKLDHKQPVARYASVDMKLNFHSDFSPSSVNFSSTVCLYLSSLPHFDPAFVPWLPVVSRTGLPHHFPTRSHPWPDFGAMIPLLVIKFLRRILK